MTIPAVTYFPPIFSMFRIKIISIVLVGYYEGALVDLLENTSLTFPITKERPKGRGGCCPHASSSLIHWQLLFASIDCRSSTFWLSPLFFGHQSPHWLFGPEFGVLEIGKPCSHAHFVKPLKENNRFQVLFIALSCMKILACVVLRAMVLENEDRYGEAFEAKEFYYRA